MNSLHIALKELKAFRDMRLTVFLLIIPSLLVLLLGTMLANLFNGQVAVGSIHVLYKTISADSAVSSYWNAFLQEEASAEIAFEAAAVEDDGREEVRSNRAAGYVEISDAGIHYYANSASPVESSIIEGMLAAFADRYNLAEAAAGIHAFPIDGITAEGEREDYVQEVSLDAGVQPNSIDYYAIAVTTMIILFAASGVGGMLDSERKRNTAVRLLASPVTRGEILIGKMMGAFAQNVLSILLVVLVTSTIFQANWGGEHFVLVFVILLTHILFALSLGLGLTYMIQGEAAKVIIMVIIQLSFFFGGAYFPVYGMTGLMGSLAEVFPLRWTNLAITQIIHGNSMTAVLPAITLNVGLGFLCLAAGIVFSRRREGL